MRTVVELIEALQSLRSTEQRDLPMKFSLAVAMIPLSQLVALAKVAEECGFSSITMPDSLFFPERGATGYPYTADGVRMWDAKTPFVEPHDCRGLHGTRNVEDSLLSAGARAQLTQSSAAGKPGGVGRESDRRPLRSRGRCRLGARGIRVVRRFPQGSRPASRRDARGTATGSRRRYGRTSRQVLRTSTGCR